MMRVLRGPLIVVTGAISAGCITVAAAPGAENVKITKNPADVAACTPVGNVDIAIPDLIMQNQAVGLSADTILNTAVGHAVAYRCGQAVTPTK